MSFRRNRSAVVREAIVRYLEDNEDLELAKQTLAETRSSKYIFSQKSKRRERPGFVGLHLSRVIYHVCGEYCGEFSSQIHSGTQPGSEHPQFTALASSFNAAQQC